MYQNLLAKQSLTCQYKLFSHASLYSSQDLELKLLNVGRIILVYFDLVAIQFTSFKGNKRCEILFKLMCIMATYNVEIRELCSYFTLQ